MNLSQFYSAIEAETCTVVFVGHSVTEGVNAQMEVKNSWGEEFMKRLNLKYPNVTFNYVNFGLNSRNLAMFIDPNFKGVAAPDPGNGTGFYRAAGTYSWQTASTVGKSWEDTLKDESPDLVVMEFGMNTNSTVSTFKSNYETAIDNIQAWTKSPSIAVLTEMLPTELSDPYLDKNGLIKRYNEALRAVINDKNVCLLDIGKQFDLLISGRNPLITQDTVLTLDSLTKINGINIADTLTYNSIGETTNTINYAHQKDEILNANITGTMLLNSSISLVQSGFRFKKSQNEAWNSGIAVQIKLTKVKIWENGFDVQTDNHSLLTVGVSDTFEIDLVDDSLIVKIGGTTVSTYTVSSKKDVGNASIGGTDFLITNCIYRSTVFVPIIQNAKYTSNELVGNQTTSDWNSGNRRDGGNSLNHPSRIGLREGFYPVIDDFISKI